MSLTFNLTAIALSFILLLVVVIYYRKRRRQEKTIDLRPVGIVGLVFFFLGLGIEALNMSEIYNNICCGPDTEEIAQQVKQALLYRYVYNFLAVISLATWAVLKWSQRH